MAQRSWSSSVVATFPRKLVKKVPADPSRLNEVAPEAVATLMRDSISPPADMLEMIERKQHLARRMNACAPFPVAPGRRARLRHA